MSGRRASLPGIEPVTAAIALDLPAGLLLFGAEGPVANSYALELLGIGVGESAAGAACLTTVDGEELAGLAAIGARGEAVRLVVGDERIVEVAPAGSAGGPELWVVRDATAEQRRLERQLLERGAHAGLGRLTAAAVHELNNHLFAMLAGIELLQLDLPADERQAERLRLLHRTTLELRELAAALSARARPRADPVREVSLDALVRAALALGGRRLFSYEVELIEEHGLPAPVVVDEHELVWAVAELLLEAGRAVAGGGSVRIATGPRGCLAELVVSGEPAEPPGEPWEIGLGVATSFAAVRRAGGSGRAERDPGGAVCYTVTLPLAAEQPPAPAASLGA